MLELDISSSLATAASDDATEGESMSNSGNITTNNPEVKAYLVESSVCVNTRKAMSHIWIDTTTTTRPDAGWVSIRLGDPPLPTTGY